MNKCFNIFGSPSSQDYDIMIFMEEYELPHTVKERSEVCEYYNHFIANLLQEKNIPLKNKINCNLAVINNGIIIKVHKGTSDEVNNSIYLTYKFHPQLYPCMVKNMIQRDIELKLLRSVRIILSFLSRTQYREIVKKGLKENFIGKVKALKEIDFTKLGDLGTKHTTMEDALKSIAFQYGQILGLLDLNIIELYSKEEIAHFLPDLKPFLFRESVYDLNILNKYKELLIMESEKRIPYMKTLDEYII